jgi:hydrogenase nickel incorporation protein HypA/HybF
LKQKGRSEVVHELSLTQNILNVTLENADRAHAHRIMRVNLLIGEMSDECEEAIQAYWDQLAAGTPAQGAELNFRYVPAELRCMECGSVFTAMEVSSGCPFCLSTRVRLVRGDDVRLESIDVE